MLLSTTLLCFALGTTDPFAPIFHVSPAGCGGGWTNDPNGPFEFNGVHHLFYQYAGPGSGTGPGPRGHKISWGHVAGNLSHMHCLPPAIKPGVDFDGTPTPYDPTGIFTGSVTVVDGIPIATYPGEPGDNMCEASPLNLSDPLLTVWRKSTANPLPRQRWAPHTTGPLGCTASWRGGSGGDWTTTIQSTDAPAPAPAAPAATGGPMRTTFWQSADFLNWTYLGNLRCPACDQCVQSCSDFFRLPSGAGGASGSGGGGGNDTWVFGINTGGCGLRGGGGVPGAFDRAALSLSPSGPRALWAAAVANGTLASARHFAYDFGPTLFNKHYATADGRRVWWAWLNIDAASAGGSGGWTGMQTLPRVLSTAPPDDASTALVLQPAAELAALREPTPLFRARGLPAGAAAAALRASNASSRHFDFVVTFRGLGALTAAQLAGARFAVTAFEPATVATSWVVDELGAGGVGAAGAGWLAGTLSAPGGSGPLAVRAGQDDLEFRVLGDGSVVEAFVDGGRARATSAALGSATAAGLGVGVTAAGGPGPAPGDGMDVPSPDIMPTVHLAANTTDAAGRAACAALCARTAACGAWVFVSAASAAPGGPRCAVKGRDRAACVGKPYQGCFSGVKPDGHCPAPPAANATLGRVITVDIDVYEMRSTWVH
eukprot:g7582.t1